MPTRLDLALLGTAAVRDLRSGQLADFIQEDRAPSRLNGEAALPAP